MREIFLISQFLGIAVLAADAVYALSQRTSRIQVQMLALNVSTILMLTGYLVEMTASTEEGAMIGCALGYFGKPFALLSSALFIADFCGHRVNQKNVTILTSLFGIFPLILCTNRFHHLYYSTVVFDPTRRFSPLVLGHGPLYFLYMATVVGTFLICLVLTIGEARRCKTKEARGQLFLIFAMLGSTILGYVIFLTGYTGGYDTTMLGAFVGAVMLTLLFLRFRLFDSLSLAKEQALDDSDTGLLVTDTRGVVVYSNRAVEKLLDGAFTVPALLEMPSGISVRRQGDCVYEITRHSVTDKGRTFGETVEIADITDKYNYSARLEQEVEDRTREIQHIQRSIATSFAGIVDARDSSTGVHIKRMARYVEILARSLAQNGDEPGMLTEPFIQCLVEVAPLHDLGKLSIPDAILQKPGRLTEEEFRAIQSHTVQGAKIIRECLGGVERPEYVEMAEKVAMYHHEKWNGKGYPEGLSGQRIPLAARIVAVADVYDAVRSERCYKPPMDLAEARQVIADGRGTHFDPAVVDAFFRSLEEIERV